jgi:hypothetical protein
MEADGWARWEERGAAAVAALPREPGVQARAAHHNPGMALPPNVPLRLVSFTSWMLLALCLAFWALRLWPAGDSAIAPPAGYTPPAPPDPTTIAKVLGPAPVAAPATPASAAAEAPADKLVLHGVVTGRAAQGVALIAVNDKAAQPFRVGGQIAERYVLQQVDTRSAVLARTGGAGGTFTLELVAPNPESPTAMRPAAAPPRTAPTTTPPGGLPQRLQRPAVQNPPRAISG